MNRRNFLKSLAATSGAGLLATSLPKAAFAEENLTPVQFSVPSTGTEGSVGNVVIVGGGMAGVTLAKYLRLWGGSGVKVTLVEKDSSYTSNIMSNTVLNGQRNLSNLVYNYEILKNSYGVHVMQGTVNAIDSVNKTISIKGNPTPLGYGRLVLAPGVEFDLMPGMSSLTEYETEIPHAWRAGPQTQLLHDQLVAIPDGGTVVISIPKAPYRCPPGPYERTCVIADWLKKNKTGCKVVVLDANADILVERDNFNRAFTGIYAGIVDYRPNCTIKNIDIVKKLVTFDDTVDPAATLEWNVLNPIPPQRAPKLLADAGLYNPSAYYSGTTTFQRFAPIDVLTYQSTVVGKSNIHIIGDASYTTMPKAGHIGNQQAKTCADAILRLIKGQTADTAPVTNSACYTPITSDTATWLSAVYQYDPTAKKMVILTQHNNGGAIAAPSATIENYEEMVKWFDILMGDTFA